MCSALCPHYPGDHFCHSINFKFSLFTFSYSTYASSGSTMQIICFKPDLKYHSKSLYFMKSIFVGGPGLKTPDNFLFSKVWEALKCTSILTEHKHPVVCFHSTSGGLWGLGDETENNFVLHQRSRDKVAVQLIWKL